MTRLLLSLALLLAALASPEVAAAQGAPPLTKYGKWVLLAGSAGLNLLAAREHDRADDAFDMLERRCGVDHSLCELRPNGSYFDPGSEALYQQSIRHDRRARRWLIAGETALVGAIGMFIWEFTRPKGRPDNIPFEPEFRTTPAGGARVGVKVAF